MRTVLFGIMAMLIVSGSYAQCDKDRDPGIQVPDDKEKASLQFLREEELLAGDVYSYFADMYDLPIFQNISRSEDVHTGKVQALLNRFNIEDPGEGHVAGEFKNPELQKLYNRLIAKGSVSLDSAIVVGLTIEEKDIYDLQYAIDHELTTIDSKAVYTLLMKGSINHLNAFHRHAAKRGITYEPRYLSRETFMEFLAAE